MTVADNTSRNQYTATSGQTVFAYTFEIVDKGDIVVLKNGTTLSEGADYSVSNVGNENGGNVTLTVGATTGDILTLYRDMPYSRTQNYTNSGDFLASEVNSDFDNLWLAGEQTNRAFSQSIRKPITDSDSISMELPEAASRANKYLSFTATGAVSVADGAGSYTNSDVDAHLNTSTALTNQTLSWNGSDYAWVTGSGGGFDPDVDAFNIGNGAVSSGVDSIALGHDSGATAEDALATGHGATASAIGSSAYGRIAQASGTYSIAVGQSSYAAGSGAISIGRDSDAYNLYSIAIGQGAQATGSNQSIAIGKDATTFNGLGNGIAIGSTANVTGAYGVGLGFDATTSGAQGVAIGYVAHATGTDSIAIGRQLTISGAQSIGIGRSAVASNLGSISIGFNANTAQPYAIVMGQSASVLGTGGIAIGYQANTAGTYSIALGVGSVASSTSATAIGYSADATGSFSTAVGRDAQAHTGSYATALGYAANATNYATAINQATASGSRSVAIGHSATASAPDSVAIGYQSSAIGTDAIGIGNLAGADAANAIHINASGAITNQPQGNGNIVIESTTAKLAYNGNWDLSTGDLTVNGGVEIGTNWKVRDNGSGVLIFSTGGVDKMKLDASGNLTVVGNVTAYGTI